MRFSTFDFFHQAKHPAPLNHGNSASNLQRCGCISDAKIVHTVLMTQHAQNFLLGSPFKFNYFCSGGVGQNFCTYMFLIHVQ
jgi:hypothetical protein